MTIEAVHYLFVRIDYGLNLLRCNPGLAIQYMSQ
jgi:hypothetical protein